jgi:hypothetical protein
MYEIPYLGAAIGDVVFVGKDEDTQLQVRVDFIITLLSIVLLLL